MKKIGIVYLVGAGPGDPGLMTLKGAECLKRADLIIYDYLANKKLLELASPKVRTVYVGKRGATHSVAQEEINQLLIHEAQQGNVVVRLKGGDPFLFGRGGEEAEALSQAGVSFEVIPGITSAIAVPAYAGIPVTHRDFTSTVAFVTGHEKDEEGSMPPDWNALAHIGTVVFLMGYATLSKIVKHLLEAGRDKTTPVAVIEWGTLPQQKKVIGTLETIEVEVNKKGLRPPTIIVVGQVVSLHASLSWFESKPLFGRTILVTRSRDQASLLSTLLEEKGAHVFEIPTIEIKPPSSWRSLDHAIDQLLRYDWIAFTSGNGVASFFERLKRKKKDLRVLKGIQIAAIGAATAQMILEKGIHVDVVANDFKAEGLVDALAEKRIKGKRILIPRAKEGREVLIEGLKKLGAKVDLVQAYRTEIPQEGTETLRTIMNEKKIDLMTFASSSTVENFMKMMGPENEMRVRDIPVAVIGPVTAKTAKQHHLNCKIQPRQATISALVEEIHLYFSHQ